MEHTHSLLIMIASIKDQDSSYRSRKNQYANTFSSRMTYLKRFVKVNQVCNALRNTIKRRLKKPDSLGATSNYIINTEI